MKVIGQKIATLNDFRARRAMGAGVIVINDLSKSRPLAHGAAGCGFLKEEVFTQKVLVGLGRNGSYEWFETLEAAVAAGARPCKRCISGRAALPARSHDSRPEELGLGRLGSSDDVPFSQYPEGGRLLLGAPPWGDGSSRTGYGAPVFAACGPICAYCDRDLGGAYESWLDLSVDHVIPTNTIKSLGYPKEWINDLINLVTACRACNEFLNAYKIADRCPWDLSQFCDLRNRHFIAKKQWVLLRHARELERYEIWRAALSSPDA